MRSSWWRAALPAFVLLSALSTLWSLATPVLASPDESAHATKAIAQVRGVIVGETRPGVDFPVLPLPEAYRFRPEMLCFAFDATRDGACGVEFGDPDGTDWFGNWVTLYNPVYYWIVGWPSLLIGGNSGILAMRVVSGVLNALVLALAFPLALRGGRRWTPMALAFAASPMVLFLGGSVNPQGVEISAGVLTWVATLEALTRAREGSSIRGDRGLIAGLVVGSFWLLNARALGPLWWLVIVLVAAASVGFGALVRIIRDRAAWPVIGVIALSGAAAVTWTLFAGTLATQAQSGDAYLVGAGPIDGLLTMLRLTPAMIEQSIGVFGWLDTFLPPTALALYLGAVLLVLAIACSGGGRRARVAVGVTVLVALIVPPLVQGLTIDRTGLIWQGRYSLAIYLGVVIVAAWMLELRGEGRLHFVAPVFTAFVVGALALYQVVAFSVALFRYTVGMDGTVGEMLTSPAWLPPLGVVPLLLACVLVQCAFSLWIIKLVPAPGTGPREVVDA